jgi:hypothetical protein
MTSMVLGDSTLESITSSVNAPLFIILHKLCKSQAQQTKTLSHIMGKVMHIPLHNWLLGFPQLNEPMGDHNNP